MFAAKNKNTPKGCGWYTLPAAALFFVREWLPGKQDKVGI